MNSTMHCPSLGTSYDLPATRRSGFSLIEVMLALGVIAIGLIAIVGMIPQGVQASRDAADNTLSATIAHDIFDTIRADPFTSVNLSGLGFPTALYNLQNPALGILAYFDAQGLTPATPQDRYYKIALNFQPQSGLPSSVVTAIVTWPDKGTAALPINTNVFVTEIANYQQ